MKKIFFLSIVLGVVFISCSTNNRSEVILGENTFFKLTEQEAINTNKFLFVDEYEKIFNNDNNQQVPLYQVIDGEGYTIFIGIPLNSSSKEMFNLVKEKDTTGLLEARMLDTSFYQLKYETDSLCLAYNFIDLSESKSYSFYFLSRDTSKLNYFYSEKFKAERIFEKQK